jgi:hypothetical protein
MKSPEQLAAEIIGVFINTQSIQQAENLIKEILIDWKRELTDV